MARHLFSVGLRSGELPGYKAKTDHALMATIHNLLKMVPLMSSFACLRQNKWQAEAVASCFQVVPVLVG